MRWWVPPLLSLAGKFLQAHQNRVFLFMPCLMCCHFSDFPDNQTKGYRSDVTSIVLNQQKAQSTIVRDYGQLDSICLKLMIIVRQWHTPSTTSHNAECFNDESNSYPNLTWKIGGGSSRNLCCWHAINPWSSDVDHLSCKKTVLPLHKWCFILKMWYQCMVIFGFF